MKKLEFFIVDVFSEQKYAGNQLAVFRKTEGLAKETMQSIAHETNFSETTFIASDEPRNGGFDVRIFTPRAEIPFAGHPTLGTAAIIEKEILRRSTKKILLNLKLGQIPVTIHHDAERTTDLWMRQINPVFGNTLEPETVAPVLRLDEADLDPDFPVQEVSTGLPYFIVPVKSLEAVKRAQIAHDKYQAFVAKHNPGLSALSQEEVASSAFFVFCREAVQPENDVHARMFDPYYGVPEDPATGSANGCLLAYLLKHNYFGKAELSLRVEQGFEMGRPSLVKIAGKALSERELEINVGGQVQVVARGEWLV